LHRKLRSIASLGGARRSRAVQIAGAIVTWKTRFHQTEGKPFAGSWLEDLTEMLEVVVWNEVYLKSRIVLAPGRVIEIKGKKRG